MGICEKIIEIFTHPDSITNKSAVHENEKKYCSFHRFQDNGVLLFTYPDQPVFRNFLIFENQVELITRNAKLESERQFIEVIDAVKHFVGETGTGDLFAREKDRNKLSQLVKTITPYVRNYAIITEKNQVIVKSSDLMTIPETSAEDIMRAITAKNFSGKDYYLRIDENNKNIYCYILMGDSRRTQTVVLAVKELDMLDESLDALYRQALFVIIVVLVFHALFALALFRYIINPLRMLNRVAAQFSQGDLKARMSIPTRNDEIASVAKSFNTMADSISCSMEKLSGEVGTAMDSLKQAERLSLKDSLTDLPNRIYLLERIGEEIRFAKTRNSSPCLFLISINDLEEIAKIYCTYYKLIKQLPPS
jgi:HAMP domain-containing protein